MKAKLLLVDDDLYMLRSTEMLLADVFDITTASTVEEARLVLVDELYEAVVIDLDFEGQEEDGLDLIRYLSRSRSELPIVVMSGARSAKRVSDAMRFNIVDFVAKEGDIEVPLRSALARAIEIRKQARAEKEGFETRSPRMLSVINVLEKILASPIQSSILILGGAGSGKEHLARHIGRLTRKSVVTTNMANHRAELADSALFGHLKGSFTGADQNRIGLIEQAHGGIFFLDEVGETPIDVQAKLLRAIQEKEISQVGSTQARKVDVRFIAATNRDLTAMVSTGMFRADLLERLSTWVLELPELKDRPEDIEFLTNKFLNAFAAPGHPFRLEASGLKELLNYAWPGNVRELRNVVERIATIWDSRVIDREAVLHGISQRWDTLPAEARSQATSDQTLTKEKLLQAFHKCEGNISRVAQTLGVHRATVYRKFRAFNINTDQSQAGTEIA